MITAAERATGIEPALKAWKAFVQPQHFARGTTDGNAPGWAGSGPGGAAVRSAASGSGDARVGRHGTDRGEQDVALGRLDQVADDPGAARLELVARVHDAREHDHPAR